LRTFYRKLVCANVFSIIHYSVLCSVYIGQWDHALTMTICKAQLKSIYHQNCTFWCLELAIIMSPSTERILSYSVDVVFRL